MNETLLTQWPKFAPLNLFFDSDRLRKEIFDSKILEKGHIATSHITKDNKNFWDNSIHFKLDQFYQHKNLPLWTDESHTQLTDHTINTFHQINLTTFNDSNDMTTVWEGKHENKSKIPLWIQHDYPWKFRQDLSLPYLQELINSFGLSYYSMIRLIYQIPPSIGLIHKDSGPKTNMQYYNQGGISITLNVSTGSANLFFLDNNENEISIDEDSIKVWHFDDSSLHCTNEVASERIQIRIYGKHPNYKNLMDLSRAIY